MSKHNKILLAATLFAMALFFYGCADTIAGDDYAKKHAPDTTPPSPIDDLAVRDVGNGFAVLTWQNDTAATKFELRFSSDSALVAQWSNSCSILPDIAQTGDTLLVRVSSLLPETRYFFAAKATDNAGNISGISNIIAATIPELPDTTTHDTIPPQAVAELTVPVGFFDLVAISARVPSDNSGIIAALVLHISVDELFATYDSVVFAGEYVPDAIVSLSPVPLSFGIRHYLRVYAADTAGNVGEFSPTAAVKHVNMVNDDRCMSCGRCEPVCPKNAVSFDTRTYLYVIDPEKCDGCGNCVSACRYNAIRKYVTH